MASYVDPMYAAGMAETFGEMLRVLISASGMVQEDFAGKAGCSATFVSNVITGQRTPPPDELDAWADVLGLHGKIRDRFMDLAMIAHLPKPLRWRYLNLLRRLERWEASQLPKENR